MYLSFSYKKLLITSLSFNSFMTALVNPPVGTYQIIFTIACQQHAHYITNDDSQTTVVLQTDPNPEFFGEVTVKIHVSDEVQRQTLVVEVEQFAVFFRQFSQHCGRLVAFWYEDFWYYAGKNDGQVSQVRDSYTSFVFYTA